MKIYSISVHNADTKPATPLTSESELSAFGYFQRKYVQESMRFVASTIIERTNPGQRKSVEEEGFVGHAYVRSDGAGGVIISDKEYPPRVAFSLLNKILDEFTACCPKHQWTKGISYPELREYINKYQDPKEADAIMGIQRELDETKIALHKTIESVLLRGEKMDMLIEHSTELSNQTKIFYKTSKKTNSCCIVM
ncbi:uncharacterized protein VTP21DRAFT_4299 [Calcarisporiella thermophila]|uniref:uncharacterized protein n=1 Tax=Calcarisporiella thermophila TaxID=911321 RepID=UPI00374216B0